MKQKQKKILRNKPGGGVRRRFRLLASPKASYEPGDKLPSGHVVDEVIAKGGSGVLLKAHKPGIQPPIYKAIKVINHEQAEQTADRHDVQEEFYGEAVISSEIGSDPYAIAVEDIIDMPDGSRALVFPFIDGHTLGALNDQHLARGLLFPVHLTAFIFHRLLSVLDHARQRDIAHRDLCPSNTMLQRTGVPMLLDWGAGTAVNEGMLIGKPGYLAPEIVKQSGRVSRDASFSADVFSLGVIIRELLTGVNPLDYTDPYDPAYDADDALAFREAVDVEALPPIREVCPDVPETLACIVQTCMRERPEDRPTTGALYDCLGSRFLYTTEVGFGPTTETLRHYLHLFLAGLDEDERLPGGRCARNLEKLITAASSGAATSIGRHGRDADNAAPPTMGDVYRDVLEAYGAERLLCQAAQVAVEERLDDDEGSGATPGSDEVAAFQKRLLYILRRGDLALFEEEWRRFIHAGLTGPEAGDNADDGPTILRRLLRSFQPAKDN